MKYLNTQDIKDALAAHLMEHRGYSAEEAEIAVSDFPNPYTLPYLCEDFVGEETIDGKEYEKNASYADFSRCGIFDVPMFRFYTYYSVDDLPNHTVGEYLNANKLFQVEDLDDEDFPNVDVDPTGFGSFFF